MQYFVLDQQRQADQLRRAQIQQRAQAQMLFDLHVQQQIEQEERRRDRLQDVVFDERQPFTPRRSPRLNRGVPPKRYGAYFF